MIYNDPLREFRPGPVPHLRDLVPQVALPLHPQKSLFDFARAKNIAAGSKAQVNFTISQCLIGGWRRAWGQMGPGQLPGYTDENSYRGVW